MVYSLIKRKEKKLTFLSASFKQYRYGEEEGLSLSSIPRNKLIQIMNIKRYAILPLQL
jgi:hypothetical protein